MTRGRAPPPSATVTPPRHKLRPGAVKESHPHPPQSENGALRGDSLSLESYSPKASTGVQFRTPRSLQTSRGVSRVLRGSLAIRSHLRRIQKSHTPLVTCPRPGKGPGEPLAEKVPCSVTGAAPPWTGDRRKRVSGVGNLFVGVLPRVGTLQGPSGRRRNGTGGNGRSCAGRRGSGGSGKCGRGPTVSGPTGSLTRSSRGGSGCWRGRSGCRSRTGGARHRGGSTRSRSWSWTCRRWTNSGRWCRSCASRGRSGSRSRAGWPPSTIRGRRWRTPRRC